MMTLSAAPTAGPLLAAQAGISENFNRLHKDALWARSLHEARSACTQQPRQMFPMARSTAISSGSGLSMVSGSEETSADVGW
jgi:hypothetical protein